MMFTLPLAHPHARSAAATGAKAARLAELTQSGFPVPAGFVVTVDAAGAFAAANGFAAGTPRDAVEHGTMPDDVAGAVRAACAALGDVLVAVRSSATAEDQPGASYAGLYESVLDVRGVDAVLDAVRQVWASAHATRIRAYDHHARGCAGMAVLVQAMVAADAAGVAFTADPVTGRRDVIVVSAVQGLGERLVSGASSADEWRVDAGGATCVRADGVLDAATATRVAQLAREVEHRAGAPQDIEWAVVGGDLRLLQARPLTALPDAVRWNAPPGAWLRNFRLGEWIGDPVTPAFETWLLTGIEDAMHRHVAALIGLTLARPYHIVVNGWYYYGFNFLQTSAERWQFARSLPRILWRVATRFRAIAGLLPPTAHLGFDWGLREWREELLPAYRTLVADAEAASASVDVAELPGWVDRLAASVGRNFASVMGVAGYAAKAEMPLVIFWRDHLSGLDGSWLELVRDGNAPDPEAHDVHGLDWVHPTLGERGGAAARPEAHVRERIARDRDALYDRALQALGDRPKLARQFERLVAEARRAHVVREEQSRAMTLAWPALRRAILRIGDTLVARGALDTREQVFFLERAEIEAALAAPQASALASRADARRATWTRQRRLAAPLVLGELPGPMKQAFAQIDQLVHGGRPLRDDEIRGLPGSPGRASGPVRIIRSADEIHRLRPGDILVAPVTTPAWTLAFTVAAAVVTDTGSIASHASIVAREYGLPAVVATGDATHRLVDGQVVTVDGAAATVRLV